jgi:hypothetical protein
MSVMSDPEIVAAPRWRSALAGGVDMTLAGGLALVVRLRARDPAAALGKLRWLPSDLIREQVPSPGQLLMGLRTVDRRNDRRVALWRSLMLVGVNQAGQLVVRRLARENEQRESQRAAFAAEVGELAAGHAAHDAATAAERQALLDRYRDLPNGLARSLAPKLVLGVVNRRLRRRLAPTRQVLVRGR